MKRALVIVGIPLGIFVALSIITATPLVGEVVTLQTRGSDGEWQTTPLWIVDFEDSSYLRAGTPEGSAWVARLQANPEVRLERGGKLENVRLVAEPARLQAVHAEMAEKYGWANDFVALMSGDRSQSLPLRIEVLE
jgi:hypothetical protein